MKQQDNQQEDREQGGKGSMEHKVFIRGTDTFSTEEKLLHGTILLSLSFMFLLFYRGSVFFGSCGFIAAPFFRTISSALMYQSTSACL
jgi:hypothetical protein